MNIFTSCHTELLIALCYRHSFNCRLNNNKIQYVYSTWLFTFNLNFPNTNWIRCVWCLVNSKILKSENIARKKGNLREKRRFFLFCTLYQPKWWAHLLGNKKKIIKSAYNTVENPNRKSEKINMEKENLIRIKVIYCNNTYFKNKRVSARVIV